MGCDPKEKNMSTDYRAMLESTSNHQPTVSNPVEVAVSRVPLSFNYKFFDKGISYSHKDFTAGSINHESCIYLDVEYDEWTGHLDGYKKSELTIMLSKDDAVAIARKFNLSEDDLS
jgi:hypothetical protein